MEDTNVINERIESCLPLAYSLINKYKNEYDSYDNYNDLKSNVLYALVRAARAFDPSYNVKFITYAYESIVKSIWTHRRKRAERKRLEVCSINDPDIESDSYLGVYGEPSIGFDIERFWTIAKEALNENEVEILRTRIYTNKKTTEIGQMYSMSSDRIRQTLELIKKKLKRFIISDHPYLIDQL
jgi:RNA polymerase sigma factor (sigma-70 family)